ncbi:hypothetical protein HC928_05905 [bacterium]|nr:hypothetical protein [bacterium]
MSALEHEVIEKFHQLDEAAQQRVRQIILQDTSSRSPFDFDAWSREVEAIRADIRATHGGQQPAIDGVEMLRGIRDGEEE